MRITTFFIDKFREITLDFEPGFGPQENNGVYGDENTRYAPGTVAPYTTPAWFLNESGGTSDFQDIQSHGQYLVKTKILYGELYKITLDTGNAFNSYVAGGIPNLNGFHTDLTLEDYWANIIDGSFVFNGITYDEFSRSQNKIATPTLMDYANGVKERIGWVEVNRARASLYYTLCKTGRYANRSKKPTVKYFYDAREFLVTAELFDLDIPLKIQTRFNTYENVNPWDVVYPYGNTTERSYTANSDNPEINKRLGLVPGDSWFYWTNNNQGHFKRFANNLQVFNEEIGGYFDNFPHPRGNDWGRYNGSPNMYLTRLVSGMQDIVDADVNFQNVERIRVKKPNGIGNTVFNVPLLIAIKEKHLPAPPQEKLKKPSTSLSLVEEPIHPEYPVDIWAVQSRMEIIPTNQLEDSLVIPLGLVSDVVYGECIVVDNFQDEGSNDFDDDETENEGDEKFYDITDPFGFDPYELDKEYKEVYTKYKFCEPFKKKIKYDLNTKPVIIEPPSKGTVIKVTTPTTEEYISPESMSPDYVRIIKIGSFDPSQPLPFDTSLTELETINGKTKKSIFFDGKNPVKSNFRDIDAKFQTLEEDNQGTLDINEDGVNDTFVVLDGKLNTKTIMETDNFSRRKLEYANDSQLAFYHDQEIKRGIRNPNDFLITDETIQYGTFSHKIEKKPLPNGATETIISIMQNGSDADQKEFKDTLKSITSLANRSGKVKPIGVAPDGYPMYPTDAVEDSISTLVEQLTGKKEIIFRGSEALYGAVSSPSWEIPIDDPNRMSDMIADTYGHLKKFQYINTGISIAGTVDLNTGEKVGVANLYSHKIFRFIGGNYWENPNLNYKKFPSSRELNEYKELSFEDGTIDFLGNYDRWRTDNYVHDASEEGDDFESTKITHLLISKYDAFNNKKENWASTVELPKETPIIRTNKGSIFIDQTGPNAPTDANFSFKITGNPIDLGRFYKIPVKYLPEFNYDSTSTITIPNELVKLLENSSSELTFSTGKKVLTIRKGLNIPSGRYVAISSKENTTLGLNMFGYVESYNSNNGELVVNVDTTQGNSGKSSSWSVYYQHSYNKISFKIPPGAQDMTGKNIIMEYDTNNRMKVNVITHNINNGNVTANIYSKVGSGTYTKWSVYYHGKGAFITPGSTDDSMQKYASFRISYSEKEDGIRPSNKKVITSSKNTYGGWLFAGLYHRNGLWPKEHTFRSGLLGNILWTPADGAVNTGAWIKVRDERVLLEYHSFGSYAHVTVPANIHEKWIAMKRKLLDIENRGKPANEQVIINFDNPLNSVNQGFGPFESQRDRWEDWEKVLDTQRRLAIQDLKNISDRVLIIRLRDNKADPTRGLRELNVQEGITRDRNSDAQRLIFRKRGHLLEEWIYAYSYERLYSPEGNLIYDPATGEYKESPTTSFTKEMQDEIDRRLDKGDYGLQWVHEPIEHTVGEFKPDEWYKAVFVRAITSPDKPDGELSGERGPSKGDNARELLENPTGIYPVNDKNKKTLCDLLYVSEQIFKMNRAKLIEMKKYVDAKQKDIDSGSELGKKSHRRSMIIVKSLREIRQFFK